MESKSSSPPLCLIGMDPKGLCERRDNIFSCLSPQCLLRFLEYINILNKCILKFMLLQEWWCNLQTLKAQLCGNMKWVIFYLGKSLVRFPQPPETLATKPTFILPDPEHWGNWHQLNSLETPYFLGFLISQARILEWAAISFSRGSSQPRDQKPGLLY